MTTQEEPEEFGGILWNSPFFYRDNAPFAPRILDRYASIPDEPSEYNVATVRLDGQMSADLDWKNIKRQADEIAQKGFLIYWDIYLGIFQNPLNDKTQFLSLSLALEHFKDNLWKDFRKSTFGVSLYRGEADFSAQFQWNEEQTINFKEWIKEQFGHISRLKERTGTEAESFDHLLPGNLQKTEEGKRLISLFCRNAVSEYLHLLAARLPDEIFQFLLLDASKINDPLNEAQLLSRTCFDRFHLAVHKNSLPHQGLVWNADHLLMSDQIAAMQVGFCLPPTENEVLANRSELNEALQKLLHHKARFKIIPEETLITEWDGLEWIIAVSNSLGPQGKRKLQGFCAAGGTCITIGSLIGLPQEIPFDEWIEEFNQGFKG